MRKNYKFISWFIVLFVITCLYLFYFLAFIPGNEAKLFDRGFRILDDYGRNMNGRMEYFRNHLKNYGANYVKKSYQDIAEYYTVSQLWELDRLSEQAISEAEHYLKQNIKTNPNINFKLGNNDTVYRNYVNTGIYFNTNTNSHEIIYHISDIVNGLNNNNLNNKILNKLKNSKNAHFSVEPSYFFEGLKYDAVYEGIVVFNTNGIIHSSSPKYQSLNHKQLADTVKGKHSSILKNITIKNDNKHLILLPLDFTGEQVYLAGFINSDVYKQRTRTINIEIIFFLAGLIILLFFSFPLLKVILISKQERLDTSDANMATVSLIFCIGLGVILIYGSIKQFLYSRDINRNRLIEITDVVHSNIQEDFEGVYKLYEKIKKADKEIDSNNYLSLMLDSARKLKKYYVLPFHSDCIDDDCLENKKKKLNGELPINDIIFIDEGGISRKSITKNYVSHKYRNELNLSKRDYYNNIKDQGKSWLWGDTSAFYIQSIQAYGTGEGEAAFSYRYNTRFERDWDNVETNYLAITYTCPSLYRQTLPSDIQFAVVDAGGATLFHSENGRVLHENLFEEVESRKIQAYIQTNKTKTLKVKYHGGSWYARIKPIKNTPLHLVTLLDKGRIQERNARIILYSIYLLVIYTLVVLIGTLIINFTRAKNLLLKQKLYTYHWLVFKEHKDTDYKKLILIITLLIVGQITAFFAYRNIQVVLTYQILVISLSTFFSLNLLDNGYNIILNKKNDIAEKIILFISTLFFIRVILFWITNPPSWSFSTLLDIIPVVFVLTAFICHVFYDCNRFINLLSQFLSSVKNLNSYRIFMGFWLILLSVLPASHIINSVSHKENIIWKRFELNHMATSNANLLKQYNEQEGDSIPQWLKRTMGHKIDSFSVYIERGNTIPKDKDTLKESYYYELLPTESFKLFNEELNPFLSHKDALNRTLFKNDTLYTYLPEQDRTLVIVNNLVDKNNKAYSKAGALVLFIALGLCVYFLFRYLLNQLLYAGISNWLKPKSPDWFSCLQTGSYRRMVLISFNYRMYINETQKQYPVYEIKHDELESIEKNKFILNNKNNKVFITGLEWYITDGDRHIEILNQLEKIILQSSATIIVCSPFEFEYIKTSLFEYFGRERMSIEQRNNYISILGKWETIFQHFYKYVGHVYNEEDLQIIEYTNKGELGMIFSREFSIEPGLIESFKRNFFIKENNRDSLILTQQKKEELILGIQQFLEPKYYFIWQYCTPEEKIALFDLADDGMLNIKNQSLINRLISKKLIRLNPEPQIFSESFRNFILTSIREEEAIVLEKKFSRGGQWNNLRFFVVTILLALAIFIFVIQGKSVDKVMAVMTSFLALIPAVLKLFEGGISFKSKE